MKCRAIYHSHLSNKVAVKNEGKAVSAGDRQQQRHGKWRMCERKDSWGISKLGGGVWGGDSRQSLWVCGEGLKFWSDPQTHTWIKGWRQFCQSKRASCFLCMWARPYSVNMIFQSVCSTYSCMHLRYVAYMTRVWMFKCRLYSCRHFHASLCRRLRGAFVYRADLWVCVSVCVCL